MLMNMGDEGNDIKRVVISEEDLVSINKEALVKIWMRQEKYISSLEQKHLAEGKQVNCVIILGLMLIIWFMNMREMVNNLRYEAL